VSDLASELDVAHRALDLVGRLLRDVAPGRITRKHDRDLASETDVAIERRLRDFLAEETPEIGFLGEEEGRRGSHERFWVLDPIDGTSNFLHHIPLSAVTLGLISGDAPVVGVIDLPFLGSRYAAAEGQGSQVDGIAITVSKTSVLNESIVSTGDFAVGPDGARKNHLRLALVALLAQRAERVRMLGSAAIDLAWLAHGRLDATIMMSNKPWDTAAGVLIAREAGAIVVDLDGSKHSLDSRATIAATPTIIDEVRALIDEALAGTNL
jgi:myo-inositol-1(or 4)-monophosphatase